MLEWLRALRQERADTCNYLFVFSGSVNLRNTLERLGLSSKINDLEPLNVPGMNEEDARTHITHLSSGEAVSIAPDALDFIVEQLIGGSPNLGPGVVKAIKNERITSVSLEKMKGIYEIMIRGNEQSLSHFHERMGKHFSRQEQTISRKILKRLCSEDAISEKKLFDELFSGAIEREEYAAGVRRLIEEGYIMRDMNLGGGVRFISPALKHWWSCKEGII